MLDRFRQHIEAAALIPLDASVLVGYSGGADSTCLLHLCKQTGLDVAAAHLHHGQRPEADEELRNCERLCLDLDIPFVSGKADVPLMSRELRIGLEEAGRNARYAFLANAAYRLHCNLIATAHTRTDLVETVLMNLTRGCGLHGLTGIPDKRDTIVRPMLPFSREETRDYCEEHGLWFHDDPANADVSFSRARIRHRVIKELRAINPGFDGAVTRMVDIVSEEDRFLNGMAAAGLEQAERPLNGDLRFLTLDSEVAFYRERLLSLPAVLIKRGLRLAVEALGATLDFHQTDSLLRGLSESLKGAVTADKGDVVVEWEDGEVHVRNVRLDGAFRHPLTVPGETISDELGWQIEVEEGHRSSAYQDRAALQVAVDAAKIKGPLYFRSFAPGDEMRPHGFSGHRKLATLLSDAKLTQAARSRLPIICDMVGPIWAPGVCLHDRVVPASDTGNVLRLVFGPVKRVP